MVLKKSFNGLVGSFVLFDLLEVLRKVGKLFIHLGSKIKTDKPEAAQKSCGREVIKLSHPVFRN